MNKKLVVLAISAIIAIVSTTQINNISAHMPNTIPYGEIGQEDQSYFYHHNVLYINAVPSEGNGLFIQESDIDQDYSIDQAIDRFGIDEDITSFVVEPSIYSDVKVTYELDDNLQFQIVSIS